MNYPQSAALYYIFLTVSCCEDVDLPAALLAALSTCTSDLETRDIDLNSLLYFLILHTDTAVNK